MFKKVDYIDVTITTLYETILLIFKKVEYIDVKPNNINDYQHINNNYDHRVKYNI